MRFNISWFNKKSNEKEHTTILSNKDGQKILDKIIEEKKDDDIEFNNVKVHFTWEDGYLVTNIDYSIGIKIPYWYHVTSFYIFLSERNLIRSAYIFGGSNIFKIKVLVARTDSGKQVDIFDLFLNNKTVFRYDWAIYDLNRSCACVLIEEKINVETFLPQLEEEYPQLKLFTDKEKIEILLNPLSKFNEQRLKDMMKYNRINRDFIDIYCMGAKTLSLVCNSDFMDDVLLILNSHLSQSQTCEKLIKLLDKKRYLRKEV